MSHPIRVGIVGVGWGSLVHVPAFRAVPEYDVVALCARNPDRLAKVTEKTGIADVSTDWPSFVRRSDLDLIVVATPVDLHREMVLAALDAGKHVLCEKPVATCAADAEEMARAAAATGCVHAVGFEFRWLPDRLAIVNAVTSGLIGDLYFAQFTQVNDYFHPAHASMAPWMYQLEKGGGFLNGGVSHTLDLIRTLFGDVAQVSANVITSVSNRRLSDGSTVEVTADDTSVLSLRTRAGPAVAVTFTAMAWQTSRYDIDIYGSGGTIIARSSGTAGSSSDSPDQIRISNPVEEGLAELPISARLPRTRPRLPAGRFSSQAIQAQALMLEDLLPAFDGKATSVPSLFDGWQVQRIIEAALSSSAGGGWVTLH